MKTSERNFVRHTETTSTERLFSAADGIRQVSELIERDPEKARNLLIALAGHISWLAEQIEGKR